MHQGTAGTARRAALKVLTVHVEGRRVALPVTHVHEVLPAAEVLPLTHAPDVVLGMLNLRGEPLPVLDLRARLGLPVQEPGPADHVLVCRVAERRVGVWVDHAYEVTTLEAGALAPLPQDAPARHIAGVATLDDGLLLVTDVDSFLSIEEATQLDSALETAAVSDG